MSLREIVKLPFLKHKDAPESFEFIIDNHSSSQYGYFLKGQIVRTGETESMIPKKEHEQAFSKGYSIGLSDDSLKYLMYEAKLTHLDECKGKIVHFTKNDKEYLVIDGFREWAE